MSIQPSGIRKFFDIVSEMDDVISLGVGEPDFDTPWHIRDEGIYTLEKGRTFYTSNSGLKELREEIAHYLKRRFELEYDPMHEVLVTVGGSEGIDVALRAMLDPGDEVLIPTAGICFVSAVRRSGGWSTGDDRTAGEESVPPDKGGAACTYHRQDEGTRASVSEQSDRRRNAPCRSGGDRRGHVLRRIFLYCPMRFIPS